MSEQRPRPTPGPRRSEPATPPGAAQPPDPTGQPPVSLDKPAPGDPLLDRYGPPQPPADPRYGGAPYPPHYGPQPAYEQAYGQPYPPLPYGQPYPPYGPAGYGYRPAPRNGLGLAGMITGIVGIVLTVFFIGIVPSVLGLIFGLIGRGRVRRGEATNGGQALAGIICGAVGIVLFLAYLVIVVAVAVHNCSNNPTCTTTT